MIAWTAPAFAEHAAPARAIAVLTRALETAPGNATAFAKLGNVHLDRYDFAAAERCFRSALEADPSDASVRLRLGRCCNELDRPQDCLAVLDAARSYGSVQSDANMHVERALAQAALGHPDDAEFEARAALDIDPQNHRACTLLMARLRKSGHHKQLLAECEYLAAGGVRHAQLLLEWGRACALNGDAPRSRRLLLDRDRIATIALPPPAPFGGIGEFNAAFAEELLTHPTILDRFPKEEANRGSRRIHDLAGGARPELVRALVVALQNAIERHVAALEDSSARGNFDPWLDAIPAKAKLHCWGLLQQRGEYESWHFHRGGWLSGVCYVRVPDAFSSEGEGEGCIEFGPPPALARAGLAPSEPLRIAPREGLLILSPSHYHHRTIPFQADGDRISFAFDVVPADNP